MADINHGNRQLFTSHLISDLKALEYLLENQLFESGVQRIGAEQEFCLIDYALRPCMVAMPMLKQLQSNFTTELAQFNLEANMDPLLFSGNSLAQLENDLINTLTKANKVAHSFGAKIILTGILPTIRKKDIAIENMTPNPRYHMLNEAILASRAQDFKFHISGIDELIAKHDNVLFESCNTSFQVHFQLQIEQAIAQYNWASAIAGPVLAACTNSPLFLGKRLWSETRIALFQQSADTRKSVNPLRYERERVTFGADWAKGNPLDVFQELVGRYKVLMPLDIEEDSMEAINNGKMPKLKALNVHNSTVYHWNRLCYGLTNGIPHLRIENRYIPAGPTIIDEVANAAFWTGLMNGMPNEYFDISSKLDFHHAKGNFLAAAKLGLHSQFYWINSRTVPAQELILKEFLPLAKSGLTKAKINSDDIDKYLGIIEKRVSTFKTGSHWILNSYNQLKKTNSSEEALVPLTEGIYKRQKAGNPVHEWTDLEPSEGGGWSNKYREVQQIMSKDLITVLEDDLLDLARNMMLWSNIHHLPVENKKGDLVGLITSDKLLSILGTNVDLKTAIVADFMIDNIISVSPHELTIEAYNIMKNNEIGCLPVLEENQLVGIITLNDYAKLMGFFFDGLKV